nr:unnamed protein product [Callosobruchus analis]
MSSEMDIEHLVKKRGILKGKLTHFEKYIDTLELDISSNTVIDKIRITELQQRIERFNKVLDDFEEIQNEIEYLADELDEHSIYRVEFEDRFFNQLGLASQTSPENSAKICCPFCKGSHNIFYCAQFLKLTVKDRMSKVKHLKLCINCLRGNHEVNTCRFGNCKICNSKHNSILHDSQQTQSTTVQLAVSPFEQSDAPTDEAITEPTTCAVATDKHHKKHPARALLDCGSQSSFISKDLADTLNLDKHKTSLCISGISNNLSYSHLKCVVKVFSRCSDFSTKMSCFIIDKITGNLPDFPIHTNNWNIPCNIKLADPTYNKPGKIDILIGADVFWQLLCVGQLNIGSDEPLLQKTRLGWVVAGFNNSESKTSKSSCHLSQIVDIQKTLSQFWEVEEVSSTTKPMSLEEKLCEQHFSENLQLSPTGKYVVSIPFKDDINTLGDSRHTAEKRFLHLEKRLLSNPTMRKLYIDFMREYEDLGHMTKVTGENIKPDYFMPHHGVLKENNLTTKLRTVFNASSPSTTGVSLNSLQMVGPSLQPDLLDILLSFRFHEIVLSSDIKMMYRMVLINPDQRRFQKIIWRESPDQPISVTYGTASGSFLAIRSLFQVANEVEDKFPDIAKIIRTNMYVDDLLTGAKSVDHAQQICSQIYDILNSRGFQLRKWRSNRPETIQQFADTSESKSLEFSLNKEHEFKTLDSSIVLAWLRTSPSLLKPFVDSRVAEIQKLTESFVWKHVSTKDNPADLLSRGVRPEAIQDCALWWFGPTWLKSDKDLWPNPQHLISDLPELRKTLKVVIIDQNVINFERFSSLARLKRSFAYSLRFIKNSKEPKPDLHLGHLSTSEINDAFHSLIRISQLLSFPSDYQRLKEGNNLSSSSRILSLSPFMDRDGLIRVGGRLKNSNLPYCRKHPILLNSSHYLTKVIIRKAHLDLLHAGTEQVLSHVRETFWPISERSVARQVVKKCVTCAKFSTKIVQPVMGNLPASRVTPDFPFSKVGVDYCGPFLIKGKRGRGSTSSKCWIALFVCFVTRAIHLELVTSLTTEAFMQTLKRFMGRRGKPNDLYSDNGTNFHLQRLHQHFWSRWSKNYLSELQQRRKWKMPNGDITIGQLVLIRDDHLPPMKWRLGRVDSMIVGSDGLSRVARIKTAEGIFSRAINRLCPLPIESTDFQPRAHVHDNHVPEIGTPDSTTATPPGERETTKKTDIESKPAHRSI